MYHWNFQTQEDFVMQLYSFDWFLFKSGRIYLWYAGKTWNIENWMLRKNKGISKNTQSNEIGRKISLPSIVTKEKMLIWDPLNSIISDDTRAACYILTSDLLRSDFIAQLRRFSYTFPSYRPSTDINIESLKRMHCIKSRWHIYPENWPRNNQPK